MMYVLKQGEKILLEDSRENCAWLMFNVFSGKTTMGDMLEMNARVEPKGDETCTNSR